MLLSPRYDGPPILTIDGAPDDQLAPVTRQRRRLEAMLAGLDDDAWSTQSRCDGWTVQDVAAHLIGVNAFWASSVAAGIAGSPTRVLAAFDPAATPPQMVAPMRSMAPSEVLDQLVASSEAFLGALAALDDAGWSTIAETPAGHVPIRVLAHHALWDGWIHERDVALPLGLAPEVEPDEVQSCLRYAAAIGPGLALTTGSVPPGTFAVEAEAPDARFVLEIGDGIVVRDGAAVDGSPCLRGDAVMLVEALSIRAPLPASAPREWRTLCAGLATAFDTELEPAPTR